MVYKDLIYYYHEGSIKERDIGLFSALFEYILDPDL